jgi:antitoxin CptB
MTNQAQILMPALAMVALTFVVLGVMFRRRVVQMKRERIHPQAVATSSQVAGLLTDSGPADNFRNLFETPVLFYLASRPQRDPLHVQQSHASLPRVRAEHVGVAGAMVRDRLRNDRGMTHCGMTDRPSAADTAELQRLRWRCRRGMRELDQLLGRYLDRRWASADAAERADFERLLDCEDDRLWRWFLGYQRPDDALLDALVQRILALPA